MKSILAEELREILVQQNRRMGLSEQDSQQSASDAVLLIFGKYQGDKVYFPSLSEKVRDRNERLFAAHVFGKVSIRDAAMRVGMRKSQAARIIKRMKKEFAATENNA